MKFIQFCIMVLVIGSNGTYHWTPNGYAAGIVGIAAAALATLIIVDSLSLLRSLQRLYHEKLLRSRTFRKRASEHLIAQQFLDHRIHQNASRGRLRQPEQNRVQNTISI